MPSDNAKDEWAEFERADGRVADGQTPIPSGPNMSAQDDEWAEFEPVASLSSDVAVAGQQFAAGAAEGGAGLAGMIKGAEMGAKVPGPAPLKVATTVGGGLLGLVGGTAIMSEGLDVAGVPTPEELPEEQRPIAYGSRSLGAATPFIAAPFVAAGRGVVLKDDAIGTLVNKVIQTAKTAPKTFGAIETVSAVSAATAAGLAEQVAPGETGIRVGAEVTAGFFAPGSLAVKSYRSTSKVVRNVVSKMSSSARETNAGQLLAEMFDRAGEDPTAVMEMLKASDVMDDTGKILDESLNNAQRTGSETLGALQKYLADSNPEYRAAFSKQEQEALDAMRGVIHLLGKTGDPQALTVAAEMKSQYVRSLLQAMVDDKTSKALMDAQKISTDTPEARAELSVAARNSIMDVISEVRKAERMLWDQVPSEVTSEISNLQSTYDGLRSTMLPELVDKQMPKIVGDFLARKADEATGPTSIIFIPEEFRARNQPFALPTTATTGELKQLRSELLDMAREATNSGNFSQARVYSDLAEATLDDIDTAFAQSGDEAYQTARRFSKEMNDTFTRSFVGKVTAQNKYGDRVAPELTLRKALATGKEAADLNFQQLQDATQFLDVRGMGTDVTMESAKVVLDAQERFTRLMFTNAIDPLTGQVNLKRMKTLVRENEALLNRFPVVKEQIGAALTSESERKAMVDWVAGKTKQIERMKAFETSLGKDPISLAQKALAAPDSAKELKKLAGLAKGGAVAGFSSDEARQAVAGSVLAAARRQSTNADGLLDLDKYMAIMTKPSGADGPSPLETLTNAGVFDKEHRKALDTIFGIVEKMRATGAPGHAFDSEEGLSQAALSLIARMAGTSVVGSVSKGVTGKGASIQAHAAGANFANVIMKRLTTDKVDDLLVQALNDKEFLIKLLEKADTPEAAEMQARQMNAWLMQATVGATTAEEQP